MTQLDGGPRRRCLWFDVCFPQTLQITPVTSVLHTFPGLNRAAPCRLHRAGGGVLGRRWQTCLPSRRRGLQHRAAPAAPRRPGPGCTRLLAAALRAAAWRRQVSCCRSGPGSRQDSNPGLPSFQATLLGNRWVLSEFLFLQQNRGHSLLCSRAPPGRGPPPALLLRRRPLPRAGGRPAGVPLSGLRRCHAVRAGGGHQSSPLTEPAEGLREVV